MCTLGKASMVGVSPWIHTAWMMVLALTLTLTDGVRGATLTATLNPPTIMEGQTTDLQLSYQGVEPQKLPPLPEVEGVEIVYSGSSSRTSINGNSVTSEVVLSFKVTAPKAGDFIIPPIQDVVNGVRLASNALQLKVVKQDPSLINRYAFLKLVLPKKTLYLGETIPIDIMLYVTDAEDLQYPKIESEGFTFSKPVEAGGRSRVRMGRVEYNVVTFRIAATAIKTGKAELGPAQCGLTLRVPGNQSNQRDLFDPFNFFGRNYQRRPVTLQSDSLPIEVLPLPGEGRPEDFTGLVGQFSWTVNSGPHELKEGDPITIRIEIVGTGSLATWDWPKSASWEEFKFYPPQVEIQALDGLGISNKRSMEQVVIPLRETVSELPEIRWSYFDPEAGEYKTLVRSSRPLQITPSAVESRILDMASQNQVKEEIMPETGLAHIKPKLGKLHSEDPPWLGTTGFVVVTGFPILSWLGALGIVAFQKQRGKNPRRLRKLKTEQTIRQGFEDLEKQASANDSQAFHATLFRMLQERLGEKMDLPSSAITESILDDPFLQRHGAKETLSELRELFQQCHEARYAKGTGAGVLNRRIDDIKKALEAASELPQSE